MKKSGGVGGPTIGVRLDVDDDASMSLLKQRLLKLYNFYGPIHFTVVNNSSPFITDTNKDRTPCYSFGSCYQLDCALSITKSDELRSAP